MAITQDGQKVLDEMEEARTVQEGAGILITNLAQFLRDNADDKAALLAKADELDASNKKIQEVIVANTPQAPGGGGEPTA